jgi:tetratricopeptide (TPR) repeat protein
VYYISNIDWGGGEDGKQAYRALNLHRELLVEDEIKVVFWLTTNEAASLPRLAPDFWAFRHRVVEFISQRAPKNVQLPAGVLAWDVERSSDPFERPADGIRAREELLRRLPNNLEALSTRIELYNSVGHLHWSTGNLERASRAFRAGFELARDYELSVLKASLLNGTGIVLYEQGDHSAGLERFKEGLRFHPSSRSLLINISAANCMLGRNHEGLSVGKKATQANPADAATWRRLGYIYNAAGKPDEAIGCITKATELAPRSPENHESLAVMYSLVDRPDDVRIHLAQAGDLAADEGTTYRGILRESMLGDADKAQEMLNTSVKTGQLTKYQIRRDPNLCLLFDATALAKVSA